MVLTYAVASWSLTLGSFVPRKAQREEKVITAFIENWKEIGSWFWFIWITWWLFLILSIFRGQIGVKVGPETKNFGYFKLGPKMDQICKFWMHSIWVKIETFEGFFRNCVYPIGRIPLVKTYHRYIYLNKVFHLAKPWGVKWA